jgi:glycyl-tRNA synthetase
MGWKEIEGLHHRGSYDLDQHSKFSGQDLRYLDPVTNEKFNPFIIESSAGFGRMFLAAMFESYKEEALENETRVVSAFPFELAPYKIAVLPLMKKDGLSEKAMEAYKELRIQNISATYDEAGSIGKRYRRSDEDGTPWCMCLDYQTLEDNTVTLRHRDTMEQVRVPLEDVLEYLDNDKFGK